MIKYAPSDVTLSLEWKFSLAGPAWCIIILSDGGKHWSVSRKNIYIHVPALSHKSDVILGEALNCFELGRLSLKKSQSS